MFTSWQYDVGIILPGSAYFSQWKWALHNEIKWYMVLVKLSLRFEVYFFCLRWEMKGKIYTRPVSFHFPLQTKKKTLILNYFYVEATDNP